MVTYNNKICPTSVITLDSIHSLLLYLFQKLNIILSIETRLGAIETQMSDIKTSDRISILLTTRVNTMELDTVKKAIFDDVKKNSNLKISTQRQETNQIRDQFKRKQ